jgi:cell division inhibitor SepF
MGLIEKVRNFINASDDDYVEEVNTSGSVAYDTKRPDPDEYSFSSTPAPSMVGRDDGSKIVDIRSSSRPHVVFKKLDHFQDVAGVADVLNEKRIVILNLETCQPDTAQRIIDFLYGVAYANSGEIKRVAGRAYIITPYNVPVTGELLDEMESSGFGGTFE